MIILLIYGLDFAVKRLDNTATGALPQPSENLSSL